MNENARLRECNRAFFLRFCHLPAGVSVGGKARYLLCLCGALFTEIGLIDPILLIDHKAHHAGFTPGYRPGQQGDALVIATGDSNRQVKALARNVQDKVREAGAEIISVEGEDSGEWVLVDIGDMVVHVMQPSVRAYYNLEELWQATPAQRRKQQAEQAAGE